MYCHNQLRDFTLYLAATGVVVLDVVVELVVVVVVVVVVDEVVVVVEVVVVAEVVVAAVVADVVAAVVAAVVPLAVPDVEAAVVEADAEVDELAALVRVVVGFEVVLVDGTAVVVVVVHPEPRRVMAAMLVRSFICMDEDIAQLRGDHILHAQD